MADEFEANYDKADVDIEVEVFEQNQYDSAIEESFDTPRSPDLMYGDYFNMSTYIHSGRVVPLDDVAQGDVRDGIYGYLWNMSTVDGKVYMMPYLARQNVLGYSKPLFSQAGLDDYIRDGENLVVEHRRMDARARHAGAVASRRRLPDNDVRRQLAGRYAHNDADAVVRVGFLRRGRPLQPVDPARRRGA